MEKITIFHWKIHYNYGKSPFLMGKLTIAMEKKTFLIGKPSINIPFSMAMLNNQRVIGGF